METRRVNDQPNDEPAAHAANGDADRARRRFLLAFPAAVFALIGATVSTAAFKFLRPRPTLEADAAAGAESWSTVAPLAEFGGADPVARKVSVRRDAGWAAEIEERTVFVLSPSPPRVVSSVCPHEGCEVTWDAAARNFLCPCHDSAFDSTGARLSGPAARGLDELPARVEGDVLKVLYRPAPPAQTNG